MRWFRSNLKLLASYPSAVAGMVIILLLVALSIYAMATMPLAQAITLWRAGEGIWQDTPRNAAPAWLNWFRREKLPVTQVFDSTQLPESKTRQDLGGGLTEIRIVFPFEFYYDAFPQEINIFTTASFQQARPNLNMTWITPDGREIPLGNSTLRATESFRLAQDARLTRRLGGRSAEVGLFADPNSSTPRVLKGTYQLVLEGLVFEEGADIDAKLVVYGQLHGLAGTDHLRRDLMVSLLWGTPIALAMGFVAAVGSTVTTMIIAAIGAWYGGWVDGLIRRVTEVNLILPVLPILIMVGTLYNRSLAAIMGLFVLLSIFSGSILTYRALFLQIKEAPYIEGARSYSASNLRIVFRYMVPRVMPVLLPQFVTLIPSFVFLEANLAVLGLGDPLLPTWGKVLFEAESNGALFNGHYYWVLAPSVLLLITGLGFSMLGFALDRVFNPRLRGL
ncbi:MAG TPA: ABC transporter permease [Limnochordales bacterium]